jgi:hypothetical protein
MLVGELKDLIAAQEQADGTLALTGTALGSDSIQALFAAQLPDATLVVSSYQIQEQSDSVLVTGETAYRGPSGVRVEAMFIPTAETVEAGVVIFPAVRGGQTADWNFSQNFPELEQTFYRDLQIADPRYTLASRGAGTPGSPGYLAVGLNFQGQLTLPDFMRPVLWLLNDGTAASLSGVINTTSGLAELDLTAEAAPGVTLGFLTLEVTLRLLSTALPPAEEGEQAIAVPALEFVSDVHFGSGDAAQDIKITAQVPAGQPRLLSFVAELHDFGFSELAELSGLVNGADLNQIPPEIKLADALKLARLSFIVSPRDRSLISVSLEVESAEPWQIIPDVLKIDLVQIAFDVIDPTNNAKVHITIFGEIDISTVGIDANLALPEVAVVAQLAPGETMSITPVMELVLPGVTLPDFEITDLQLSATQATGSYSFDLTIIDDWEIVKFGDTGSLSLRELFMSIACDGTGQGVDAQVVGLFNIAGVDIDISAVSPGSGAGWQFGGETGQGQAIPVGRLMDDLVKAFGDFTLPAGIADLVIENLAVSLDTQSKDFTFTCDGKFPVGDEQASVTLSISLLHDGSGGYSQEFRLIIDTLVFDLRFVQNTTADTFAATYSLTGEPQKLNVRELVGEIAASVASYIPESLQIDLKDVLFAYGKDASGSKFLFGMDIGTGINLSNLPLVGQEFPPDQTVGVDDLRLLVASKAFNQTEATAINSLLPEGVTRLPTQPPSDSSSGGAEPAAGTSAPTTISDGLNVSAIMKFGNSPATLSLPVANQSQPATTGGATGGQSGSSTTTTGSTTATTAPSDGAKWFTLQKAFGPVIFQRVGVQYQDEAIAFLLDAALSAAGLTLSLSGLSVGSPLDGFAPRFSLRGIGIDYKGGSAVEIGGTFLRVEATDEKGEKYDEYDGAAVIKAEGLTLSAIGSYARLNGHPSLFVYAVLDYPLGGPTFFFVTGLAAGFGYNRSLTVPSIDRVAQFPLVAEAVNSTGIRNSLTQEIQSLHTYIPPALGEMFLAFGVKFTSFKLIDSFVLLTVSFGTQFEVNVLGLSTLIVPTPEAGQAVTPLAEVQMAVKATYQPDQGFLGVAAQLTSASYILSRNCKLTGGFAFYSWFSGEHKGEFVQTIGGYHPSFNAPDYYPQVPRLGFNWRVDNELTLKGDAYYALTASTLMTGGHLQATWESGSLKAKFNAGADFIISWKPYHYDAKIHIEAHVSYTFHFFGTHHIKADVGANLHIWGPEFAGTAHIDISVISFDISFGSSKSQTPKAISWDNFKSSFLPADDAVCSISLQDGLVSVPQDGGDVDWVVNPKAFVIVTDSVIPAKAAHVGADTTPFDAPHATAFGVGSMGVASGNLTTSHTVTVSTKSGAAETEFEFVPVLKRVPVGLWGESLTPSLKGAAYVEQALTGFEIRPKGAPAPGETADIPSDALRYDPVEVSDAYAWADAPPFVATADEDEQRREAIRESLLSEVTAGVRAQLLTDLGVTAEVSLSEAAVNAFTVAPQVEAAAG